MARRVVTDEELLRLWAEHESYRGVASACGVDRNSVRRRLQRLRLLEKQPVPEGFRATQVTVNAAGEPTSVQSKPDPEDAPSQIALPALPDGFQVDKLSSYIKDGEVTGQWVKARRTPVTAEELADAFQRTAASWSMPPVPDQLLIDVPLLSADLLNHFVWGDPHIGLLSHARETGSNFDLRIATEDLKRSADLLMNRAPLAKTAVFCEVGDLWHAQDDKQATPRGGNKLDVDGRKAKILDVGLECLRYMIDRACQRHEMVVVVCVPGNHDPDLSIMTRAWLAEAYRSSPQVQVMDNTNPYMYVAWQSNLFMYTHGDKRVKPQELGEIMLADQPELTGRCRHRRAFTGHIHHKQVQEFRTFRWESFNSLCARDFWHHAEGYRSERLVECITFHARYGEQGRCRVTHEELRDRT